MHTNETVFSGGAKKGRMLSYDELINKQRQFFYTNETKNYEFRIFQLELLESAIRDHEEELCVAFWKDLRKSEFEVYSTEIGFVLSSIKNIKKNLKKWMTPQKVKNPIYLTGSKSYIVNESYGVSLIIGAFNYPFQLTVEPLAEAAAAGNTAVVKPSELTPNVSSVIMKMINQTFPENFIHVVEGDADQTARLLEERFDCIFFTGSRRVGKIVMEAASKNLTPVTLELGGKSPVIVAEDANVREAAEKIVWGKFLNAGQTCVAPDHLLVDEKIKPSLISEIERSIHTFYGADPSKSGDYGRMATETHWKRIDRFLQEYSDRIVIGGKSLGSEKYIAPTVIDHVSWGESIMEEEIFGPILPVMSFSASEFDEEVVSPIQKGDKPLALYLFTQNPLIKEKVIKNISFGGGTINGTLLHLSNICLPFGGVGSSGMGNYHGIHGFKTFSHQKAILEKSDLIKLDMLYPPYSSKALRLVKKILK
ncbi:MAG: aldehyde dehydrogenase family protein [Synergistaceae bacterium]|nr:aldehyde dehydrogenase family protein [Synergistaceae bacterium]